MSRCSLAEKQEIKARLAGEKEDPGRYEALERWVRERRAQQSTWDELE